MKDAGLNPILAYQQRWSGASGASASNVAPDYSDAVGGIANSAVGYINQKRERALMDSQVDLQAAQVKTALSQQNSILLLLVPLRRMLKLLSLCSLPSNPNPTWSVVKMKLTTKMLPYDAVMNRVGQVMGMGASATSIGRLKNRISTLVEFRFLKPLSVRTLKWAVQKEARSMTKTPVKSMTKVYHYFDRPQRNAWVDYPEPDKPVLQGAALECDINRVVARLKQGLDPGVQLNQGVYRDNTGIPDMKTNLDVIRSHESAFADLPDAIRQKFRSPLEYYEAQQKKRLKKRADQCISL